ncbi:MAG: Uma2 family endonuclease [Gammaproteobacteria bacterium]|nr:Uma2 family endonuclease [Gammaproteobacteria bacterium]
MSEVVPQRLESTRATYKDVLEAPEHRVAEIVDGVLHTHPRPAMPHALASSRLGGELGGPFDRGRGGPGGWWIVFEPELHLGEDILVPDLGGWCRERMPDYPDTAYVTLAPDWACEVLSPSTRKLDLHVKRRVYAREGVRYLWFVDPLARTLEVFELREDQASAGEGEGLAPGIRQWVLIGSAVDDDPINIRPFDAITFNLDGLWP